MSPVCGDVIAESKIAGSAQSVFGRNWFGRLRPPDLEGHAPPYVQAANGVSAFDGVVEPHLNGDRAEVVTNQATDGYL